MAWGSAQEPASLYSLLAAFPDSQLGEVGLCWLDPQDLPPDWGFSRQNLPFLGASPDGLLKHPLSPPQAHPTALSSSAQDATVSSVAARSPQHASSQPMPSMDSSVPANSNAAGTAMPTGHLAAQDPAGQSGGVSFPGHAPFSRSAADHGTASSMPDIPTVQDIEKQLRQQQLHPQHELSPSQQLSDAGKRFVTQPVLAAAPAARLQSATGSPAIPVPAMATSAARVIVGAGPAQPQQAASNGQQAIMDLLQLLQTGGAPSATTAAPVSMQGDGRQSLPSAAPGHPKPGHPSPSRSQASAATSAQGTAAPRRSEQAAATKQPQPISRCAHHLIGCCYMKVDGRLGGLVPHWRRRWPCKDQENACTFANAPLLLDPGGRPLILCPSLGPACNNVMHVGQALLQWASPAKVWLGRVCSKGLAG